PTPQEVRLVQQCIAKPQSTGKIARCFVDGIEPTIVDTARPTELILQEIQAARPHCVVIYDSIIEDNRRKSILGSLASSEGQFTLMKLEVGDSLEILQESGEVFHDIA
ncbi:hypothetical protein FOL47_002404, partial [Perkinsus chesapeaki]